MLNFRYTAAGFLGVLCGGIALTLPFTGCDTLGPVSDVTTSVLTGSGVITTNEAESINRTAHAVGKTFQDITPPQEYYLGRSVAAGLLTRYKPWDQPSANTYLNQVGQSLALFSGRPETYGGYHFLALDSDEINAFAAPGGLILVTRGMLRLCADEDELAAVLAHEIGHVQHKHGLRAIQRSRLTTALTIMAAESARTFGDKELAELTRAFEGSIDDVTQTLVNNGYGRRLELEADAAAIETMKQAGYDPNALLRMLQKLQTSLKPGQPDFARTHPRPELRVANARNRMGRVPPADAAARAARSRRLEAALSGR